MKIEHSRTIQELGGFKQEVDSIRARLDNRLQVMKNIVRMT
jgi:hypothetical protein